MGQQMHLNLFIHSRGHHEASWRHPKASPKALTDISYFVEAAKTAERGLFDSIFLADTLVVHDGVAHAAERSSPARSLPADLENASFETLGAKVAELGLTLDFDIAAELARIEANKRRSLVKTSARSALWKKIYYVLGAGLKAQQGAEREAAGSASQVLALSNRGRAHSGHRELRRWAPCALTACASVRGRDTTGQPWRRCSMSVCDRTAKRLFEGAKQALGFAGTGLSRSRAPRTSSTLHEQH